MLQSLMLKTLKPIIAALSTGLVFALAPAAFAQDKPVKETQSEPSKTAKDSKAPDALDEMFKDTEETIKNGDHCGPTPEPKETPIT